MRLSLRGHDTMMEGVIWRPLLQFFFPILLGTFFQQLYNTVDAMVVGKFVGKVALAAVGGATGNLINLLVGFFVGLSSGATVILSQFWGARQTDGVQRAVHTAAAMALLGGALLMGIGLLFSEQLLTLMGTPAEVMPGAVTYIRIYFLGTIPMMIYNIGSGLLRAVGDSRRPLLFLVASCMTNIVLDVLFVLGMNMGVAGAAYATILSEAVSAVLVVLTLMRSTLPYRLHLKKIRLDMPLLGQILRIGFPAGLQSVLYSISNVIIQVSVNGFGTDVLAAWTAYGKMDGLFWMTSSAFGVAITTFAGQNFGAKQYDRMRRGVMVCLGMAAVATLLLSATLLSLGGGLFRLFSTDEAVVAQGLKILHLLVPTYITYLGIEIFAGAVRGAGDSLIPTLMTLAGVCVLRLIWVLGIAPSHHDVTFMLLCYPITWSVTSLMFIAYYFKGGWLQRCIRKAAQ